MQKTKTGNNFLTNMEVKILTIIEDYKKEFRKGPSQAEIARRLKTTPQNMLRYIKRLFDNHYINIEDIHARLNAITIYNKSWKKDKPRVKA